MDNRKKQHQVQSLTLTNDSAWIYKQHEEEIDQLMDKETITHSHDWGDQHSKKKKTIK